MAPTLLQYAGGMLAIVIGLNGLIRPGVMGRAVGLSYINEVGRVEIRVLFGSFLVALPLYAISSGRADFFVFFGVAALAAAIIKTTFTVVDKCPINAIWVGILVDVVLATCLLSSLIF